MPREHKRYGVWKGNDCVFTGTRFEVAEHFGIKPNSVYDYALSRKKRLFRMYVVKDITNQEPEKEEIKEPTEKEKNIATLLMLLKMHGNAASEVDPTPYLPDLYDNGFDCTVREVINRDVGRVSGREKEDIWYVVECVGMVK